MTIRKKLAALAPITVLAFGVSTTPLSAELKSVYLQAEDMHFSNEMQATLRKVFPRYERGVGRVEEEGTQTAVSAEGTAPSTRAVRIVKTRQLASAVTDDEWTYKPRRKGKASGSKSAAGGPSGAARGATLFVEENRDLEERMGREIGEQLKIKGYEVQAVTAHMETLTSVKVVILATTGSLSEENAKARLSEMRTVIERDVLKGGYPNVQMTRGSTFSVASTSGARVAETSAMLYELDRPDFKPVLREKTIAIASPRATPPVQAVEAPPAPKPRRVVREESAKAPAPVGISEKEKADKAREQTTAAKAAPATTRPVSQEVSDKSRKETITPSESDFQD